MSVALWLNFMAPRQLNSILLKITSTGTEQKTKCHDNINSIRNICIWKVVIQMGEKSHLSGATQMRMGFILCPFWVPFKVFSLLLPTHYTHTKYSNKGVCVLNLCSIFVQIHKFPHAFKWPWRKKKKKTLKLLV